MADLTIRNLIDRVSSGDIRIPAFQRDFVWASEQVAFLIDSIYKGFPIGTIILWQTDERLNTEKHLGSFELPEPKRDYPTNYVLDGQQRLTSLFSVFQNELVPKDNSWVDVYFDMEAENNPQDTCFYALTEDEVEPVRHFPMKTFFETVTYRAATKDLSNEQAALVDSVQEKFKEYRIQNQTFETSAIAILNHLRDIAYCFNLGKWKYLFCRIPLTNRSLICSKQVVHNAWVRTKVLPFNQMSSTGFSCGAYGANRVQSIFHSLGARSAWSACRKSRMASW